MKWAALDMWLDHTLVSAYLKVAFLYTHKTAQQSHTTTGDPFQQEILQSVSHVKIQRTSDAAI